LQLQIVLNYTDPEDINRKPNLAQSHCSFAKKNGKTELAFAVGKCANRSRISVLMRLGVGVKQLRW